MSDGAGDPANEAVAMVTSSAKTFSSSPGEPIEVRPAMCLFGVPGIRGLAGVDCIGIKRSSASARARDPKLVNDFDGVKRRGKLLALEPRRAWKPAILPVAKGTGDANADGNGTFEGVSSYEGWRTKREDAGTADMGSVLWSVESDLGCSLSFIQRRPCGPCRCDRFAWRTCELFHSTRSGLVPLCVAVSF